MKLLWCWRCKMDLPMLDEAEYERVTATHGPKSGPNRAGIIESFHGPVLREFERITGFPETNPNAVYHHRLSLYGPPCAACGKPLRTPQAKLCAACGLFVVTVVES